MLAVCRLIREDLHAAYEGPRRPRKAFATLLFNAAFHAIAWYRIAHACYRWKLTFLAHAITYRSKCTYGVEISPLARIGRRFRMVHGLGTVIGGGTVLGDDCVVYQGVTLGTGHPTAGDVRYPVLEDHVTVYAGAKVVGGVTIGAHAVVGANAVVVAAVPAGSVVVGIPGTVIRTPEGRVRLLERGGELAGVLHALEARLTALEARHGAGEEGQAA